MIRVSEFDETVANQWDDYVVSSERATFFHLSAWRRVIESVFRHNAHYIYAEQDGQIIGVLPLVHVKSRIFGNALVSTPFCVYGGPVAEDSNTLESLVQHATTLARRLSVDHLELRCRELLYDHWPNRELYVTFRKELSNDPEENFHRIPRKQRAMIRKGAAEGLEAAVDETTGRFFRMYSTSVRNLGTPTFSRRYFDALNNAFGEDCEILTITRNGKAVSSVMSFYFRDEVLPYYGGGIAAARKWKANDFMYWELMRRASEKGTKMFDFGRSKRDSGSYRFKKHWGFEPESLYYQSYLVAAKSARDLSPANPKYRVFIEAWKRLPLPLTRMLGPKVSRFLG